MDDYDIRFVNGSTITYVRRDADAADFADATTLASTDYGVRTTEDDCRMSAIEAIQYHDDMAVLDDRCYAIESNRYVSDDSWVFDGFSANRTNRYEADIGTEWTLEIVDDDCTWESAITTDRSNADVVHLDWGSIGRAFKREDANEHDGHIKSSEDNDPKEIVDEKGGALDDFLDSFGGE